MIIGDWQEATQFNPYYLGQVTEANVASLVWHTLLTISDDFKYVPQLAAEPIPTTENGGVTVGENGDAMTVTWKLRDGLKWSDGEPLTCDDFKYAWEWVMDPDNVGVITAGWEDITNFECASDTDMIWHFGKVYEGYLTLATAPLPRHYLDKIPVKDQVNGAGFRPDEVAKPARPGPVQVRVGHAAGRASPRAQRQLRRLRHRQARQPRRRRVQVVRRSGRDDRGLPERRDRRRVRPGQDSDLPKVQDLGDQVAAIPALLYEFLRPNWSPADAVDDDQGHRRLLAQRGGPGPRRGLPDG